jgi:hypothetical protein
MAPPFDVSAFYRGPHCGPSRALVGEFYHDETGRAQGAETVERPGLRTRGGRLAHGFHAGMLQGAFAMSPGEWKRAKQDARLLQTRWQPPGSHSKVPAHQMDGDQLDWYRRHRCHLQSELSSATTIATKSVISSDTHFNTKPFLEEMFNKSVKNSSFELLFQLSTAKCTQMAMTKNVTG